MVRTDETAKLLGVSPRTVRRFDERGDLRAVRLSPRSPRRFRLDDILQLLERANGAAA